MRHTRIAVSLHAGGPLGANNSDRITLPGDLTEFARDSDRRFEASGSDVRRRISPAAVPWLIVTYDVLREMPLDSRMGFVLSRVDGRSTVEMLLDVTGIAEDETMDILHRLVQLGVIELRGG